MYMQRTTSGAAGNGLHITIKYMRGASGIGMGTTIIHLRCTTRGAAGNGLHITIKYMRCASGIGMGTTIIHLRCTTRGAAGNGLGATMEYLRRTTSALKMNSNDKILCGNIVNKQHFNVLN
jgi:hypothetical protein